MSESPNLPVDTKIWPTGKYLATYSESLKNPEKLWTEASKNLTWHKPWNQLLDWKPPFARWYVGGELNASENAVDRHMSTWRHNKVAYYWEGEPGDRRTVTYTELYREVNRFANVLYTLGIRKGDVVAVYLPLVPEFPITLLACARLGVTFTVIFSGFSSKSLVDRINDCQAKIVVTADGGYRRGKIIPLKPIVDEALNETPSVEKVVVLKRTGSNVAMKHNRDYWWHDLIANASPWIDPVSVESSHPLYILYTSGTTGKPKGAVHSTGGYLVWTYLTQDWVFDPKDDDVYWCTADIGWVTGHTYVVFGPLMHGLTSVMYEGAIDYPEPDRIWRIIEHYGVNILYTAPTAIRSLMKYGNEYVEKHDLKSLRLLGTVGEPINPAAWDWYYRIVGSERCAIVDTWWQTETGGIMISPSPKLGLVPLKPGSATYPLPGIEAEVVDEHGKHLTSGRKGFLIIKRPWPGMFMTLRGDPERYREVYWKRFPGYYYPGDYAVQDADGYFWLLGRADEVLKVAGHRLGTIEVEDALVAHPAVAEAAVAARPDPLKGEGIIAFVTLKRSISPSNDLAEELRQHVRKNIGPIASPDAIYFTRALPKTRSGKIMRRVIRAVASGSEIGDLSTLEDDASVEEVKAAVHTLLEAEGKPS